MSFFWGQNSIDRSYLKNDTYPVKCENALNFLLSMAPGKNSSPFFLGTMASLPSPGSKPGECPSDGDRFPCAEVPCSSDTDCGGDRKCCGKLHEYVLSDSRRWLSWLQCWYFSVQSLQTTDYGKFL